MAMSDNGKLVFGYLKDNFGKEMTAHAIAEACGVTVPTVTGVVNALVKKGFAVRNEITGEAEEGKKAPVIKHISLTDAGLAFDPEAVEAK